MFKNNKVMRNLIVTLVALVALGFTSCEKENIQTAQQQMEEAENNEPSADEQFQAFYETS